MQVPVYNSSGEVVEHIDIRDDVFAVPFNQAVVHQAMVRQQANARQGTASTKTRGEVNGSTRKLYRQKHTGYARAGSRKSPLRRGGGIVFGPKPRSYRQDMPKKMRQLALKCLLSDKVGQGELLVLNQFDFDQPRTSAMARVLAALGIDSPALIVTPEPEINVIKSARNLAGIKTLPAHTLNTIDLLSTRKLLMTVAAIRQVEQIWGERASQGRNGEPVRGAAPPTDN
ncbi:MAG: 50S ribosomal protein L4 [Chloroflexota bacterium]